MPRKTFFKKRTTRKIAPSNAKINAKVIKLQKSVKRISPIVVQHNHQVLNNDIYTTPNVEVYAPAAALPSTVTTTKSYVHSVWLKGVLELDTAGTDTQFARILIVQDMRKFDADTAPTWADLFESTTVYSHRTDSLSDKKTKDFKILEDKTFTLTKDSDATVKSRRLVSMFHRFKTPLRQFNYSNYQQGQLYLMYMSTAATTQMDFDHQTRFMISRDS
jgi:predicted nuclease of predicted toxin-antitoxin system